MRRSGFTIVELIVVIAIIAIILGLGLPAFNSMTTQSRMAKALQQVSGVLTRAHVLSVAERNLTAVRFSPAQWELDDKSGSAAETRGLQVASIYRYMAASRDPQRPGAVRFQERFERVKTSAPVVLPGDTWVAPAESIVPISADRDGNGTGGDANDRRLDELVGNVGAFEYDADRRSSSEAGLLLTADDFLVVFDPDSGARSASERRSWPISAYSPTHNPPMELAGDGWNAGQGRFQKEFKRFAYSGVTIYSREPFVALGRNGPAGSPVVEARRSFLAGKGQTYFVDGTNGGLRGGR